MNTQLKEKDAQLKEQVKYLIKVVEENKTYVKLLSGLIFLLLIYRSQSWTVYFSFRIH